MKLVRAFVHNLSLRKGKTVDTEDHLFLLDLRVPSLAKVLYINLHIYAYHTKNK